MTADLQRGVGQHGPGHCDADIVNRITASGLVPVVTIDDARVAPELADALVAGGVTAVEITLRTPSGLAAIEALASRDDLVVGAGTVVNAAQVDEVARRGARFVVSPGFALDVVERAIELGLTVLPGVATASELQRAVALGLTHVKLFPIEQLGGLSLIGALSAPFPGVSFMPSGGVNAANVGAYLAHPSVFAAGCSWITPREAIASGDFARIRSFARAARDGLAP